MDFRRVKRAEIHEITSILTGLRPRLNLTNFKNFGVPKVSFYNSIPLEILALCYVWQPSYVYYFVFGDEEFLYKRTDLLSIETFLVNNGITKTTFTSSREMVVTTNSFNVIFISWHGKRLLLWSICIEMQPYINILPPLKAIDGFRGLIRNSFRQLRYCMYTHVHAFVIYKKHSIGSRSSSFL